MVLYILKSCVSSYEEVQIHLMTRIILDHIFNIKNILFKKLIIINLYKNNKLILSI